MHNQSQKESDYLPDEYYLVLGPLPFNLLLVYQRSFDRFSGAEKKQMDDLPDFKIWGADQLDEWTGKIVYVPLKRPKAEGLFILDITAQIQIEVDTQEEALMVANKALSNLRFSNINTTVASSQTVLKGVQDGPRQAKSNVVARRPKDRNHLLQKKIRGNR